MSYDSVKKQHAEINRTFEGRYDELSGIAIAVKDGLKRLVAANQLDEDAAVWALRSLDFPTLFRFYKKHKWDKAAAVSALVKNAVWRSNTIPFLPTPPAIPLLRFIESRDRFDRPILIIRARFLSTISIDDLKSLIITTYELGRLHVAHLYSQSKDVLGAPPSIERVLQFTLIADLQGLGIRDIPMDLMPWIGQTVIPNYPGIIGPSYIINYSWAYNGLWQLCKRMLPQRAVARIFFPSHSELREHIPSESLLEEYGGLLKLHQTEHDPSLLRYLPDLVSPSSIIPSASTSATPSRSTSLTSHEESIPSSGKAVAQKQPTSPSPPLPLPASRHPRIPARSHMNTYYGYPVEYRNAAGSNQVPQLAAGRRRKRDLVKTLLILLIRRLANAVPNLFLEPVASVLQHRHGIGFSSSGLGNKRKWRAWVWWALCAWLVASFRKALRIRKGAIVNGVVSVDGRLRNMGISLLVGGEFLRRLWMALNMGGVLSRLAAPVPMVA